MGAAAAGLLQVHRVGLLVGLRGCGRGILVLPAITFTGPLSLSKIQFDYVDYDPKKCHFVGRTVGVEHPSG